jgi:hypothetical protein
VVRSIGVVLALNKHIDYFKMPTEYNFAFGRDREVPLGSFSARRLRFGVQVGTVVNLHFVQDGKPWELQHLDTAIYPPWLSAIRIDALNQWLSLALHLGGNQTGLSTVPMLSDHLAAAVHRGLPLLDTVVEAEALQICRCFVSMVQRGGEQAIKQILDAENAEIEPAGTARDETRRAVVIRQVVSNRHRLHRVCAGSKEMRQRRRQEAPDNCAATLRPWAARTSGGVL